MKLDRTDYRILHHLQNNARISNIDLAEAVGLSPAPCLRRTRALEKAGVISLLPITFATNRRRNIHAVVLSSGRTTNSRMHSVVANTRRPSLVR